MLVSLLSLVGTPPSAVFLGKLTTFTAGWDGGLLWLVLVALLNSVASLFYYLRWIIPTVERVSGKATSHARRLLRGPWAAGTAILGAALVLVIGIGAGLVLGAA